jgi:hypothetical protein
METCPECGFTYGALPKGELARELKGRTGEMAEYLTSGRGQLHVRRTPDEWSVLEYGCHVRDVCFMQRDRLYVALVEDRPAFKPMYREQRVAFDRYGQQIPSEVAAQLVMAACLLANAFNGLAEAQWKRPLVYAFPEPSDRTVEWMAHHTLHEAVHHLVDVERILDSP